MALWFCFACGGFEQRFDREREGRDTQEVNPGGTSGYRRFRKRDLGKVQM